MQTDAGAAPEATPAYDDAAFLSVRGLTKHFDITGGLLPRILYGRKKVHAVQDVSFDLRGGRPSASSARAAPASRRRRG